MKAKLSEKSRKQISLELKGRTDQIKKGLASGNPDISILQTLLKDCPKPVIVENRSIAINAIQGEFFKSDRKALEQQISLLKSSIQSVLKKQSDNPKPKTAQEIINQSLVEFSKALNAIDDGNGCKANAVQLYKKLDQIKQNYCQDDKTLEKETMQNLLEDFKGAIQQSKSGFKPQAWHLVANAAIICLNAIKPLLKSIGFSDQPFQLFNQGTSAATEVEKTIKDLEASIDQIAKDQPAPSAA